MSENLEHQYDQVLSYIDGYRDFIQAVGLGLNSFPFRLLQLIAKSPKIFSQSRLLSGKNSDIIRTTVAKYATDDQKTSDYFSIAVSDYPIDTLSINLKMKFSEVNFSKLKMIHDLRKANLSRFNARQIMGFVLAAATILLKSVPKRVVEDTLGITYEDFEVVVFWVTVALLGYLLLILLPTWFMYSKAKTTHAYVGGILEYTAIKHANV